MNDSNDSDVSKFISKEYILPSSRVDLSFIAKLFDILDEANNEIVNEETGSFKRNPESNVEEFEKIKKEYKESRKLCMQLYGTKGELNTIYNSTLLKGANLPDMIRMIIIDNFTMFKFKYKYTPPSTINLICDFEKPNPLDSYQKPSERTENLSKLEISGHKQSWVNGTYARIISCFDDQNSGIGWLHKSKIYDLFLWLITIPLIFLNLFLLERNLFEFLYQYSSVIRVMVYIYVAFFFLYIYLIIFNYVRYLFPYMDLNENASKSHKRHKYILGGIITIIISNPVWEMIKLISSLFAD